MIFHMLCKRLPEGKWSTGTHEQGLENVPIQHHPSLGEISSPTAMAVLVMSLKSPISLGHQSRPPMNIPLNPAWCIQGFPSLGDKILVNYNTQWPQWLVASIIPVFIINQFPAIIPGHYFQVFFSMSKPLLARHRRREDFSLRVNRTRDHQRRWLAVSSVFLMKKQ